MWLKGGRPISRTWLHAISTQLRQPQSISKVYLPYCIFRWGGRRPPVSSFCTRSHSCTRSACVARNSGQRRHYRWGGAVHAQSGNGPWRRQTLSHPGVPLLPTGVAQCELNESQLKWSIFYCSRLPSWIWSLCRDGDCGPTAVGRWSLHLCWWARHRVPIQ